MKSKNTPHHTAKNIMTQPQGKEIQYRIKNICEQGFSIKIGDGLTAVNPQENVCPQNPYFDVTLGTNIPKPTSSEILQVNVLVGIEIFISETKAEKLADLSVVYEFEARNSFSEKKDAPSIILPEILLKNLFQVAVSSTRGILFARLKGTPLQHCILPLINTEHYIQGMRKQKAIESK
jgi:hypothetical protein